ncbi:hypothetical protein [Pseudoalteromonas sp. SG43-5]|uniref:hypothetical protein n=1 Tax=Pseudoalteromonas sp. SG43-5 TaxID=2760968 RepID=UPI0015FF6A0B|nr:hypothetical protein [Pseudoalteromonas sp. SG43-5]MBB1455502.1 hypothetical protein [Pseudoalteromonas sp. SG43-5]
MEFFEKKTLVIFCSALTVLCGGVFAITKYANQNQIQVVKEQLKFEQAKVLDLKDSLSKKQNSSSNEINLPKQIKVDALANPKTRELIDKVEQLEKEKSELLKQLSISAVTSLDPNSEVSILLEQLSKGTRVEDTISTLFKIKSPISFEPMASYFIKHDEGASIISGQLVSDWFEFFTLIDETAGLSFAISRLANVKSNQYFVYGFLSRSINSKNRCDMVSQDLERIALTHDNAEIRGNAKLLLECKKLVKKEAKIKERIAVEYNIDVIETYHSIYVLFNKLEIESDFYELVSRSNRIYFWSTGTFLYERFTNDLAKREIYLKALEIMAEEEMSKSSNAYIYYLLSNAYSNLNRKEDSKKAIEMCKKIGPVTCEKLTEI